MTEQDLDLVIYMENAKATDESKQYLGDGLYASFDGYHVILTAEDGVTVNETVYLESSVAKEAIKYMEKYLNLKK